MGHQNTDIASYVQRKWRTKELFVLLEQFENDLENAAKGTKDTDQFQMLILRLVGTSLIRTREIIVLCEAGYPDGAFFLSRQLFEQMVFIFFFLIHEKEPDFGKLVEDYDLNARLQIYKYNVECATIFESINKEDLQREIEDIKKNSYQKVQERNDYWWAGKHSFYDLWNEVKLFYKDKKDQEILNRLHLFYTATNRTVHANAAGNRQRLGRDYQSHVIDTAPCYTGQGYPLYFATLCMIVIIVNTCHVFGIATEKYKKAMNELAAFYNKTIFSR